MFPLVAKSANGIWMAAIGLAMIAGAANVRVRADEPGRIPQSPFDGREITAQQRDYYDRWIDQTLTQVAGSPTLADPRSPGDDRSSGDLVPTGYILENANSRSIVTPTDLERAGIDVKSFRVVGDKNLEFPWMLYRIEFADAPLYYANPKNAIRRLSGTKREAVNAPPPNRPIPNSSFFTNVSIPSYTPERIAQEFEEIKPAPPLAITKVKKERTSEGIWVKDARGRKYILLFDPPFGPEMTTSAEYIGSTLARMVGYYVPKVCITTVEGTGNKTYDGRRAVATLALENFRGGWRYNSFRDRREIRGLQLLAAWLNNVDQTEQNTGLVMGDNGIVRHYILDFGASLGSFTFRPQMARLGWTRLFAAYEQFSQPLYDRGIRNVPWQAPYRVQSPAIGFFTPNFDPDRWQPFYTNMGFIEVTEADRIWMAHRIAQVTDEQIHAVVSLASYSRPQDAQYVAQTLIARRDIIIRRYLTRQGPLAPTSSR